MSSSTFSSTYTTVDVRRVFDQFAADYDMAAQATGLVSFEHVTNTVYDVKAFAERGYINRVDLVLTDAAGNTIRANKYTISTNASLWTAHRPGGMLWPKTPGGQLTVVIFQAEAWAQLPDATRATFQRDVLRTTWGNSYLDTTYSGMVGNTDRRYVSNSFGLERTAFTR